MVTFRIDNSSHNGWSAQRFAEARGLERLGQTSLAPMADADGVVTLDALERLARVAGLDDDGVLSRAERQRVNAALDDRRHPIIGTPNSSCVDARCQTRKPVEGYVAVEHSVDGGELVFNLDISLSPRGRGEFGKRIVLQGITPNERHDASAISVQRYGVRGENASTGAPTGGVGAGYIVGIADKERGVVLANLSAAGAIAGDAPDVQTLLTPRALAFHPAVRALAEERGLEPRQLLVEVLEVSLHSDFVDVRRGPTASHAGLHTLLLELELRQEGSRKEPRRVTMTALVEGNVGRPLARLAVRHLAEGADIRAGFVFPTGIDVD